MKRYLNLSIIILMVLTLFWVSPINVLAEEELISPIAQIKSYNYKSIKLTWNKIEGADGYIVYRATSKNGKYTKIKTTTSTSFTNSNLTLGKTYYYKIKAYKYENKKKIYSTYSEVINAKVKPSNVNFKINTRNATSQKLTWDKVSGANRYYIYKCDSNDLSTCKSYKYTSNTYLTVNSLKLGEEKFYAVKACRKNGSKYVCGNLNEVKSSYVLPGTITPTITNHSASSLKITFEKEDENIYYDIGIKETNSDTYNYVKTITPNDEANFIIEDLTANKTYDIIIKSYLKINDTDIYGKSTKQTIKVIPEKPTNLTVKHDNFDKVKITFNESVDSVDAYRIYRSTSKTKGYKLIGTTTENTYYDENVTYGKTYYYRIKFVKNGAYSPYSSTKSTKVEISTPKIKVTSISPSSISINITPVEGADGYVIYRATSKTGKYTKVKITPDLNLENTGLTFNKNYYYKVKAFVTVDGVKKYSSYSNIEYTKPSLLKPTINIVDEDIYGKPEIKLDNFNYVDGMEVYRSTDNINFKKIKTTSNLSYIDTTAKIDTVYYYKVKTYKYSSGKKVYSKYSNVVRKYIEEGSGKIIQEDGTIAYKNDIFEVGSDIEPGIYKVLPIGMETSYVTRQINIYNDEIYREFNYVGYIEILETDTAITISNGKLVKYNQDEHQQNYQNSFTNGVFIVGKDIEPGLYKVLKDENYNFDSSFYFESAYTNISRLNNFTWEYDELIATASYPIGGYIEVKDTDLAIEVYNGTIIKYEQEENIKNKFTDGTYLVGDEIEPGIYKVTPHDNYTYAMVKRLNELALEDDDVIAYKAFEHYTNLLYMEVKESDKAIYIENGTLEKVNLSNVSKKEELSTGIHFMGYDSDFGYYYNSNPDEYVEYLIVTKEQLCLEDDDPKSYQKPFYRELFKIENDIVAIIIENGTLTKSLYDEQIKNDSITKIEAGTYIIGEEITVGIYKFSPESWGYMSYTIEDINGNILDSNSYINGDFILDISENAYKISFSAGTLQKLSN